MSEITADDIQQMANMANIASYGGAYSELGGGEINDTFRLECADIEIILRVAKYPDQTSLANESATLKTLDIQGVPRLVFFDDQFRVKNRLWIAESYIEGSHVLRLDINRFENLGRLLAKVHASNLRDDTTDIWSKFLLRRKQYGNEAAILAHPEERLRKLAHRIRQYVSTYQAKYSQMPVTIIHGDATPTNILVEGNNVSLIDWEFSHTNDPMAEFSTIYYDDMDYNDGKWRVHITPEERKALFRGYEGGGGSIDEDRIRLWMMIDKLGASLYLYWRLYKSGRETKPEQEHLYKRELEKLISSLQTQFAD